jgi:hypothetical protein
VFCGPYLSRGDQLSPQPMLSLSLEYSICSNLRITQPAVDPSYWSAHWNSIILSETDSSLDLFSQQHCTQWFSIQWKNAWKNVWTKVKMFTCAIFLLWNCGRNCFWGQVVQLERLLFLKLLYLLCVRVFVKVMHFGIWTNCTWSNGFQELKPQTSEAAIL